jgi:diguanylate cyclase (GGDEF)-like protein/PAS domain S-box-containing protein
MADESPRQGRVAPRRHRNGPEATLARHIGRVVAIFDAAPIGVGVWSVDGELLHANPVLCDLLLTERDDLVGQPFEAFIEPDQAPQIRQFVEDLWRGERNYFPCDLRCRDVDGGDRWMRAAVTAVYGPGARPAYLLSQIFDFADTRVHRSAAELMATEAPVMLWLTDRAGVPRAGSRRTYEFLGESPRGGELRRSVFERTHPADFTQLLEQIRERTRAARPLDVVARTRRADGEWRALHHLAEPVFAADGRFSGYAGVSVDVTDRERLRAELAEARRLLRSLTEAGPLAVARLDRFGRIVFANSRWSDFVEDPQVQLAGTTWRSLLPPEVLSELIDLARSSARTGEPFERRAALLDSGALVLEPDRDLEGVRVWAELRVAPVRDEAGRCEGWIVTLADVSAEMTADSRADRLARVLDAGSDFLMIAERSGAITYVNNAAQDVLGVTALDPACSSASDPDLLPETPDFLTDVFDADSLELYHEVIEPALASEGVWRGELVFRSREGDPIPVSALILAHRNRYGRIESVSAVARDISDLKVAQSQLQELATHDYLTGMPNRVLLYDRLEQALARYRRYGQPVALLYLDLDRFKPVNDEYGHHVGDKVLQRIADRINQVVRDTDTAARIGGDEFCVLVEGLDDPDQLRAVAERLIEALDEPVIVEGAEAHVGCSIGLVSVDDSCADADALMALADAAMYRAKAAGRGCCVVYGPGRSS